MYELKERFKELTAKVDSNLTKKDLDPISKENEDFKA